MNGLMGRVKRRLAVLAAAVVATLGVGVGLIAITPGTAFADSAQLSIGFCTLTAVADGGTFVDASGSIVCTGLIDGFTGTVVVDGDIYRMEATVYDNYAFFYRDTLGNPLLPYHSVYYCLRIAIAGGGYGAGCSSVQYVRG